MNQIITSYNRLLFNTQYYSHDILRLVYYYNDECCTTLYHALYRFIPKLMSLTKIYFIKVIGTNDQNYSK